LGPRMVHLTRRPSFDREAISPFAPRQASGGSGVLCRQRRLGATNSKLTTHTSRAVVGGIVRPESQSTKSRRRLQGEIMLVPGGCARRQEPGPKV